MYETNYDLFQKLKEIESDDSKRNTLEGIVITSSSLSVFRERSFINIHDYGLNLSKRTLSFIHQYIESLNDNSYNNEIAQHQENIILSANDFTRLKKNYPDILRASLKIALLMLRDDKKDYKTYFQELGKKIEDNFERFYNRRNLEKDPILRQERQHKKTLKLESFYFGNSAIDTYKRFMR